ncbi:hypothetical protein MYCTH_2305613 [Thermothelomyces thermophilus ATCC 42464]|uniref:gluconokinase n=1 Tax=Thermothelomyces thermophilus (strain ATCC 42464 / BCRC 31852 / DSM 1799) TaxID=573729 RepID=G2QDN7_THET4|nr:uncharacterized protein MYCTH_2305613 [Thermothelomyces thermophilus ATCC 42464]AEO58348.1 hypothetical protein MYCTH_2305613 [Thermothelomyces thermophilus ATCC 42464]
MARNEPLTDEDRAAWLDALHERVVVSSTDADADGVPVPRLPHRVVTCSALKRRYRDALRGGDPVRTAPARVRFVFLDVHEEVLRQRARERKGHFAGEGLVKSQVEALERPGEDEEDVIIVRVENGEGVGETEREVLNRVVQQMGLE